MGRLRDFWRTLQGGAGTGQERSTHDIGRVPRRHSPAGHAAQRPWPAATLGCARVRAGLRVGVISVLLAGIPSSLPAQNAPPDFTAIVRQQLPAVVAIMTRQMADEQAMAAPDDLPFGDLFRRFYDERRGLQQRPRSSLGSGFVISADGHVVTNNHVIENAQEVQVVFPDKTTASARLVGRDPSTDIAVLKIEPRPNMAVARWGNSDAVEPGAWVIAIGSPFGLGGTVTVGVLSARSRDIQAGLYDDFLQTDASINQGNSGGPLFNTVGEVIGVNTAIFSPVGANVGIGFAVPSRTAQAVAEQLIRSGRVERGYLGVRLQEVTPALAQALRLREPKGALVASVEPGSPAERAGLRTGDVVTAYGGRIIESPRDLTRAVAAQKPGTQAPLTVQRGGGARELTVALGQRSEEAAVPTGGLPGPEGGKRLGIALGPLDEAARRRLGVESGVIVERTEPSSPAAESGIRPGDIIVAANDRDVAQPADVADEWAKARRENKPLLLRIRRDGQYLFVAVEG
jgi:serine protease Do